jgi:c-di-GMP-binding flagellar brake protein YcgR
MASAAKNIVEQNRIEVIKAFKHLLPGAFIDLQLNADKPVRIKGKLIGYDEGQYLIISTSTQNLSDYKSLLSEGQGVIVRTIAEGAAGKCIAFRTTVLLQPSRPKGTVFLTYPKQIESINLRKEARISTMLPVVIMHRSETSTDIELDGKTELKGKIIDISSGGCRVLVQWPAGQKRIQEVPVYLKVQTGGDLQQAFIKAVIKNQTREDPENVSLGLMFIHDEALDELTAFLKL